MKINLQDMNVIPQFPIPDPPLLSNTDKQHILWILQISKPVDSIWLHAAEAEQHMPQR